MLALAAVAWYLVAQQIPTEPLSPLASYGLLGAVLGLSYSLGWFIISGYRKDISEYRRDIAGLRDEVRQANEFSRDKTIPVVISNASALEANTAALREATASNSEVVRAVAQLYARGQRDG